MNHSLLYRGKRSVAPWLILLAVAVTGSNCHSDDSENQLRILQSKAIEALSARDARLAHDTALKLASAAEMNSDLNQSVYLLTAAAVMDAVGMTVESRRVMGVRARLLQNSSKEIDTKLIAELLKEIQPFSKTIKAFHVNMQFELLTYYGQVLAGTTSPTLSVTERVQQLEQLLGEHELLLLESNVPEAVASILNIGNLLAAVDRGDNVGAEKWLKRLVPLVESPDVASKWKALVWNKATDLSIKKRRFAEALEHGRQFAVAAVQSGDFDAQVTCVEQLAVVYLYMGDYAAARFLLSQTEAPQKANPNIEQANLWRVNMSKALEGDRQFLLARQLLLDARELTRDAVSFDSVMIRNNLAINYYLLGNLVEAKQILQECQKLLQRIVASDLQLAESHITAGWFNLADKDLKTARDEFRKAQELLLGIPGAGKNHPRFAEALACEARVAAAMGDDTQAMKLIEESEALAFNGVLVELAATGAARDRLAILQSARVHPECVSWPGVFDTYLELAESIEIPVPKQFETVLKWKGVLGRLEVAQRENNASSEILALNQKLRDLYFRSVSRRERKQHLQGIELIENEIRVRERDLAKSMLAGQSVAQLPTSALVEQLDAQTVFVDILQVRKFRPPQITGAVGAASDYLAFIALSDGNVHRVSLGEMDEIDAAIDNWRKQIVEMKAEASQTSKVVANYLQQPLLKYLTGADTLLIREDGMCHIVPWAALPGTAGKDFWIENLAICTIQDVAATQPATASETAAKHPSILIVGGVEYGPLSDIWKALPGTLQEANLVADLFRSHTRDSGKAELLSGNMPTKSVVLRDLQSVTDAHLATHGFYLKQDMNNAFGLTTATSMLNSGLILAPPVANETGNQQLTAAEISECDLRNLQLVVLSACETGMGKIKAGQGVDGLASSFHTAGVGCVISSRWKVPDTETSKLMSRFYQALWGEKMTPAKALREAQMHMLHAPELGDDARKPVSWAAFTTSFASPTCRVGSR